MQSRIIFVGYRVHDDCEGGIAKNVFVCRFCFCNIDCDDDLCYGSGLKIWIDANGCCGIMNHGSWEMG